ncbi:MAG TPA: amino acid permease [Ktedonobacteraceae bacterium]|nr:amino acid permease [Ktedonobacteraceae bacterium]
MEIYSAGPDLYLLFFLFQGSNFTSYGGLAPLGIAPIFLAVANSGIVFSFLGFRQGLDYGSEAKNPQRDVLRATILSVIIATVLYALLQIAFTGAINWGLSEFTRATGLD